jgi:hypothetical protein
MSIRHEIRATVATSSPAGRLAGRTAALSQSRGETHLAVRLFWTWIALHAIAWTLLATWTQPNRPLDQVEMLYWGQNWQWGYYKHPPLPAWIAAAIFEWSSGAAWPLYLVGQLMIVTSFWAAWRIAREVAGPWAALAAAMLLECSSYYNLTTGDLNNSIVLQPLWALSVWFVYRGISAQRLIDWAAAGLTIGLGMLTKYDLATLVCALLVLPIISPQALRALRTPGPYITLVVSVCVFAPHVAWMIDHNFPTIQYALERAENSRSIWGHLANPIEFLLSQCVALLPMAVVASPLWRRLQIHSTGAKGQESLASEMLTVVCCGPLALDLFVSLLTGMQIQSMWGASMWTFAGAWLVANVDRRQSEALARRVVLGSATLAVLMLCLTAGRNTVLPYFRHKCSRPHFPGVALAQEVERVWRARSDATLSIVAGPWWPAANVSIYSPLHPRVFDFADPRHSPWLTDEDLAARGGVIVWEDDWEGRKCPGQVQLRFPDAEIIGPVDLPWQTGAAVKPARFGMAVVLPRQAPPTEKDAR